MNVPYFSLLRGVTFRSCVPALYELAKCTLDQECDAWQCNRLAIIAAPPLRVVSYPDPNVRKHYRLQYNTAYIGSGQQVEESCSWNVIGMFDNLGCHSNGYVITIKREVCFCVSVFA